MTLDDSFLEKNWPSKNNGTTPHPIVFNLFKDLLHHRGVIDGLRLAGLNEEGIQDRFIGYLEKLSQKYSLKIYRRVVEEEILPGLIYALKTENHEEEDRKIYLTLERAYRQFLDSTG